MAIRKKSVDKKPGLKNYYSAPELASAWSDDPKNNSEISQVLAFLSDAIEKGEIKTLQNNPVDWVRHAKRKIQAEKKVYTERKARLPECKAGGPLEWDPEDLKNLKSGWNKAKRYKNVKVVKNIDIPVIKRTEAVKIARNDPILSQKQSVKMWLSGKAPFKTSKRGRQEFIHRATVNKAVRKILDEGKIPPRDIPYQYKVTKIFAPGQSLDKSMTPKEYKEKAGVALSTIQQIVRDVRRE